LTKEKQHLLKYIYSRK